MGDLCSFVAITVLPYWPFFTNIEPYNVGTDNLIALSNSKSKMYGSA